jgi:HK97 family phage major capsid protein/HK97 family phage prohead protease
MFRSAQLTRAGLDKDKRTITVRFSTQTPVKRWFGTEVLSHDAGAVKLERFNAGAAVLMEHDTHMRCGITESATITSDGNGEAVVRFSRNKAGDECMAEVEDGTLRYVSVGYVVNRFESNEDETEYRAIEWEPLEVSFVGIPADPNAKILRNAAEQTHESKVMKRSILLDAIATEGGAPNIVTKEDFSRQLDEVKEISALVLQYQRTHPKIVEIAEKAIRDGTGIRKFQSDIIPIVSAAPTAGASEIVDRQAPTRGNGSIGDRFVASESYRNASRATRGNGKGGIGRGNHVSFEIPDRYSFRHDMVGMQTRVNFGLGTSDVSTSTDIGGTGGTGVDIMRQFNLLGQQPLNIADLFSQGTTSGDVVRYVRELSYTQAAARVAEAAAKPQAQLDVGVINATVEKTAVYLDVTEEMMNDQEQASSYINGRLSFMVQSKEEDYLLNGTGSSQIYGVLGTTGIQTISGATNTIDNLLRAKAYVEGANGAGFTSPDAYVMNPLDYLNVRLTKDSNGQYLFGGPGFGPYGVGGFSNVGILWGLPVVTNTQIAQGTALVGAFKQGGQIFRRQGLVIKTTDSDGSKFLSNIITVLAESRFALAIYQPNRFCSITGIPPVS